MIIGYAVRVFVSVGEMNRCLYVWMRCKILNDFLHAICANNQNTTIAVRIALHIYLPFWLSSYTMFRIDHENVWTTMTAIFDSGKLNVAHHELHTYSYIYIIYFYIK